MGIKTAFSTSRLVQSELDTTPIRKLRCRGETTRITNSSVDQKVRIFDQTQMTRSSIVQMPGDLTIKTKISMTELVVVEV